MKQAIVSSEMMRRVLESAAEFQELVPDAVLVALEQGDLRPELAAVFRLAVAPFDAAG